MDSIKRGRGRPEGTKVGHSRHLTADEWWRFISYVKEHRPLDEVVLFGLTYALALRVKEACTLQWSAFNFPSKQVSIKGIKDGLLVTYPIPPKLRRIISELHRQQGSPLPTSWVFLARDERTHTGHLGIPTAQQLFKRHCRAAGITAPHSIHDLRHSLAFDMAADNQNSSAIAAALRHKSVRSASAYLTPNISEKQQAALTLMLNRSL